MLLLVAIPVLVVPQTQTLFEARDALCAGNLEFVYYMTTSGVLRWSHSQHGGSAPKFRECPGQPAAELGFTQKTINEILARKPGETCNPADCTDDKVDLQKPRWGMPTCCFTEDMRMVLSSLKQTSEDRFGAQGDESCLDLIDVKITRTVKFYSLFDGVSDGTCPAGCGEDPYRPVCRHTRCISPSCSDAAPYCHELSVRGNKARRFCPNRCLFLHEFFFAMLRIKRSGQSDVAAMTQRPASS